MLAVCYRRKLKFIWNSVSGEEWFFDLEKDPQELHNLTNDKRISAWRKMLVEYLAAPDRISDGLSDGNKLIANTSTPQVTCRKI